LLKLCKTELTSNTSNFDIDKSITVGFYKEVTAHIENILMKESFLPTKQDVTDIEKYCDEKILMINEANNKIKSCLTFSDDSTSNKIANHKQTEILRPMDSPHKLPIVTPMILIECLQAYTSGVAINKTKDDIDFSYGFCCFFKTSKAINREANYRLAQSIQTRLNSNESIATVFANVDEERNNIRKNIILSGRKSGKYSIFDSLFSVNLGIRSVKLNEIIKLAKSSLKK
jgi:hypothetical protein